MVKLYLNILVCRTSANLQLGHETTLEFTTEDKLTVRGDCIAGISCKTIRLMIDKRLVQEETRASGILKALIYVLPPPWRKEKPAKLVLNCMPGSALNGQPARYVLRKSSYDSNDTLGLLCDKAAKDLSKCLEQVHYQNPFYIVVVLVSAFRP